MLPARLEQYPALDAWVRVDEADTITVFTGKVELGQGIVSALARIASEELDVAFGRIRVETADTDHGLDELYTAGSMSLVDSGTALRQAAAEAGSIFSSWPRHAWDVLVRSSAWRTASSPARSMAV